MEEKKTKDSLKHLSDIKLVKINERMNKVLVIGAGSVGTLIGMSLVQAGFKVTFAGKPESNHTKLIAKQGLKIIYPTNKIYRITPNFSNVSFTNTQKYLPEKFPLIIVALKSNDLEKTISYIKHHSTPESIIVHAQNSIPYWWFNDETYLQSLDVKLSQKINNRPYLNSVDREGVILKNIGDRQIVGCVVQAPCHKTKDGFIKVKKPPKLIMGLTKSNAPIATREIVKKLCQTFSSHNLPAIYTDNIRAAVYNKLAINATTNVLSALTGKVIGDLTANYLTNNLIKKIIEEINYVFQCYGIQQKDLATEFKVYSYILAPGSQKHLPSLAQDFLQHRQGEVSLITAPVEMAEIAEIEVPTLSSLAKLLQLGQTYTLNTSNDKSHILTFDRFKGYYVLTNDVCQNQNFKDLQTSEILADLIQINISAFHSLSYSA